MDVNVKWPDKTGFSFDTSPGEALFNLDHVQERANFYGAPCVANNASGYQRWGNWSDKFEPDVRFAAISDTNAFCQQFPEVDSPWKFTDYIFQGTAASGVVVEPPLFNPFTLAVANGVYDIMAPYGSAPAVASGCGKEETFRCGIVGGVKLVSFESLYNFKGVSGKVYKQEDLEKGTHGTPWTDPAAPEGKQRTFKRQGVYGRRGGLGYWSENKGVRIYKKDLPATCVKIGAHGNIPPHSLSMSAPKAWLEPDDMYSDVIVPKVTATFGAPLYAWADGVVSFAGRPTIQPCGYTKTSASGVIPFRYSVDPGGVPVPIPEQRMKGASITPHNCDEGDLVHKGCQFWEGTLAQGAGCSIQEEVGESGVVVDPSKCQFYPSNVGPGTDVKAEYSAAGGLCPLYQHTGQRLVGNFSVEATNSSEFASAYAGIEGYSMAGGAANLVDGKSAMAMSDTGLTSLGFAVAGDVFRKLGQDRTEEPSDLAEADITWNVTYEFKKVQSEGRELSSKASAGIGSDTYKRGTGKFAFDKKEYSYGGVDENFFGDRNNLSAHRFGQSCMPCYKPGVCDKAHGFQYSDGYSAGSLAGVDGEPYCKYYNGGCPGMSIPRRALEYDEAYSTLLGTVLAPFRQFGMDGFPSLSVAMMGSGVYHAMGQPGDVYGVEAMTTASGVSFFCFDSDPSASGFNLSARVFGFIDQRDADGVQLSVPGASGAPWLVELLEDYASPSRFVNYIDNERPFMGGRAPEYKDYSRMGEEVLCQVGGGGSIYGLEGGDNDPESQPEQGSSYYIGYRVDKTGDYIVDGRGLGGPASDGSRMGTGVDASGAVPIFAYRTNSVITADDSFGSTAGAITVYSSDTQASLAAVDAQTYENDLGSRIYLPDMSRDMLPAERDYYICPACGVAASGSSLNYFGEPVVDQVVTDLEYARDTSCPRCSTALSPGGKWAAFPGVYAKGVVNVWGLPGQEVCGDGYYWRNPVPVGRQFVTQILSKLGGGNTGGGYELGSSSANATTEASVAKLDLPYWAHMIQGTPGGSGDLDHAYLDPGYEDGMLAAGMSGLDNSRPSSGVYTDNLVSPYAGASGLDMVSVSSLKMLRNHISPVFAVQLGGSDGGVDFSVDKQPGYKDRYGTKTVRSWEKKMKGLPAQVIGANSTGRRQYVEFWDGNFPGRSIYYYFPTDPIWWRRHKYVGFIQRDGLGSALGLDSAAVGADGGHWLNYTGNVRSNSFHFLQGWLPMDKEVDKAFAVFEPVCHPTTPAVGIVWSGARYRQYFNGTNEQWAEGRSQADNPFYWTTDSYRPSHGMDNPYFGLEDSAISKFVDTARGYFVDQSVLAWGGYGSGIISIVTEQEMWKRYTSAEFSAYMMKERIDGRMFAGRPGVDGTEKDFKMFSRSFLDIHANNETQPIPGYFDLSGMNDKLLYHKDGPKMVLPSGLDWTEGGEVVIQDGSDATYGGGDGSSGGAGNLSAGWSRQVMDISSLFKSRYDERIDRGYKMSTGKSFQALASGTRDRFEKTEFSDGLDDPQQYVNYRYFNSHGMWLSDPWHFPLLDGGEMPVKVSGDLYAFSSGCRFPEDLVTDFFVDAGPSGLLEEGDPGYDGYHVSQLALGADGSPLPQGSEPAQPSGYWMCQNALGVDQSFVVDLIGFPVQTSHRDWRAKAGRWNMANAICQNQNCFVGRNSMSVATYIQWCKSSPSATVVPTIYGTKCLKCGSSLLSASGAFYEAGDGIETAFYGPEPDRNHFVTAVRVGHGISGLDAHHGFCVDYMPEDGQWRNLFSVGWDDGSKKWNIPEYGSDKALKIVQASSLPDFFTGFWAQGGDVNTASDYEGKNFVVPLARMVRFRSKPVAMVFHKDIPAGSLPASVSSYMPASGLVPGYWDGGSMEIPTSDGVVGVPVLSNSASGVFFSAAFDFPSVVPSGSPRLENSKYLSYCSRFEVYGHETEPGDVLVTPEGETELFPFYTGLNKFQLGDRPTKITSVRASSDGTYAIPMDLLSTRDETRLRWQVGPAASGTGIVGGACYYDRATNSVEFPTVYGSGASPANIWDIDGAINPDSVPVSLEVRYFTGNGTTVETTAFAVGTGPSYVVERDAVCNILGCEPAGETPPAVVGIPAAAPSPFPDPGWSLPIHGAARKLQWTCYNTTRMDGDFSIGYIKGDELGASKWNEGDMAALFGGSDQIMAGIPDASGNVPKTLISGTASGTVEVTGPPGTMLSGDVYLYAKRMTRRDRTLVSENGSMSVVSTYERTGGFKSTGFALGYSNVSAGGGSQTGKQAVCFSTPQVYVFMKERDEGVPLA
jgi:hypothetical protein